MSRVFFPCVEIVDNFIFPKIWTRKFWEILRELRKEVSENPEDFRVLTHTRFFLSSLMWGIFARKNDIKWIHLEHGSGYVKSWKWIINHISYLFDRLVGKWIISKADTVLVISHASKNFINVSFWRENVSVFYRGVEIEDTIQEKSGEIILLYVGRLSLLKWVSTLIEAFGSLDKGVRLVIIWDGEETEYLKKQAEWEKIEFLWFQEREYIIQFLLKNNCILINPSYQEGMPTTVIEALATKNVVVATDVGGTSEISSEKDLILVNPWNTKELEENISYAYKNFSQIQWLSYPSIQEKFSREKNIETLYNFIK